MKKLIVSFCLVIFLLITSCYLPPPDNTTPAEPVAVLQDYSISGNKGIFISDKTMTYFYSSVTFANDVWVFEQTALNSGITHIDFYLHNGGGCPFVMFDFIASMEIIQKRGITITTYARGIIASAAVPLFVMGDERIIYNYTWVMIHPGGWKGNEYRFSESRLKMYGEMELLYANIVASRTNISLIEALKMLNYGGTERNERGALLDSQTGDNWFNTHQALKLGIATKIHS